MKVLFYLPVVTPWWFDEIIAPMLRALHGQAELHVMIAPLWRNTGIDGVQLAPLDDLDGIAWHVIDHDDPATFRLDGTSVPGLLTLVDTIAPDLVLARSADTATPAQFPGLVRYVMEGAAAPFQTDPRWIVLEDTLFAKGVTPLNADEHAAALDAAIAPYWPRRHDDLGEQDWRIRFGLPFDRPIVAVPLHYEHDENFFMRHAAYPSGVAMLDALIAMLGDDICLAVSDHPLNRKHVDRSDLHDRIADDPERLVLVEADEHPGGATAVLAAKANGVVVDLSKVWSLAAGHCTPIFDVGLTAAADWLGVHRAPAPFESIVRDSPSVRQNDIMARRWFAAHLGARVIDPTDALTPDGLLRAATGSIEPHRLAPRIATLLTRQLETA